MVPLSEAENSRGGTVLGKTSLVLDIIKLLGVHLGRNMQQQNCGRSRGGRCQEGKREDVRLLREIAGMETNKQKKKDLQEE